MLEVGDLRLELIDHGDERCRELLGGRLRVGNTRGSDGAADGLFDAFALRRGRGRCAMFTGGRVAASALAGGLMGTAASTATVLVHTSPLHPRASPRMGYYCV